jgi:tetratricopeptide (TPR) repeat protein
MPPGGTGRGDDALERAMSALNAQRPIEAERIARETIQSDPRHARALHVLGYALLMQGRAREAIETLEPAVRGGRDPEIETQLAIALRQAGRTEDALSRLQRAIKRRPPFVAAFHELGCLLVSMRRYDEAIESFRRGLEIAPMTPELSIQLGYIHLQRGKFTDAMAAFARALGIAPSSHDALLGMGIAHQEVGDCQSAADYYRRCLTGRPSDDSTWLKLGHCLLELGQLDAGYDCFRTAARGDQTRYGRALGSLVKSRRGRFWLKPSHAARFLREKKS